MLGLPQEVSQLLFLAIPGFVAVKVFSLLVPGRRVDAGSAILEALAYGAFNFGIWFWLYKALAKLPAWDQAPWWAALAAFVSAFVSPALLALLTWWLRGMRTLRQWLGSPIPTAWDYFFARRGSCWMLFKLRSGVQFGGYFGPNSFASTYPEARDLYVEDLWRVDDHGRFTGRVEGNLGAVVRFEDCHELQFFQAEEAHV